MIHSRPGTGQYTTKEFGVRCAVKTEQRDAAGEESKDVTSTESIQGQEEPDTGTRRKERRHSSIQGQGELDTGARRKESRHEQQGGQGACPLKPGSVPD